MFRLDHRLANRAMLLLTGLIAAGIAMGQGTYPGGPGEEEKCRENCFSIESVNGGGRCITPTVGWHCTMMLHDCDENIMARVSGNDHATSSVGTTINPTCTVSNCGTNPRGDCINCPDPENCPSQSVPVTNQIGNNDCGSGCGQQ